MSYDLKFTYGGLPATSRGRSVFLGGDPKGENFLYCCGQGVFIRNIKNPLLCDVYTEHQTTPTVAKYSPSGFYICSGDDSGKIRIWDTTQAEHPLKIELQPLSGRINDLAWTGDSKRIAVGGEGRNRYAHAFLWDSGSSVGELSGHSKTVYSVDLKPNRPFRCVTGSEDFSANWYEGPPFKYKKNFKDHERFVNCVRFSNDGSLLATSSSDKTTFLYDGKTGEKKLQLTGHKGGIYSHSFTDDNLKLLTASGDKTCKLWDIETGSCISTFQFENTTENQQYGTLIQGEHYLSVDYSGRITYLDPNNAEVPIQVILGHNKYITGLAVDRDSKSMYTSSYDSVTVKWDMDNGETFPFTGKGHTNQVVSSCFSDNLLYTGSWDDTIRITPTDTREYNNDAIATDGPVTGVDFAEGALVASTIKSLYLIRDGQVVQNTPVSYTPQSIAISKDGTKCAVGGEDKNIHLYDVQGDALVENTTLTGVHRDHVLALDFSNDGNFLASGGKDRYVICWDMNTLEKTRMWTNHNSKINSVAFNEDNIHIASGSLDQAIFIWDRTSRSKKVEIPLAHRSGVNKVEWLDGNTCVSAGMDMTARTWQIEFP